MGRTGWWTALFVSVGMSLGAAPGTPGITLEAAPASLPHRLDPAPTLAMVRADVASGDRVRALRTAERYLEGAAPSRERAAVQLLVGMLHREAGRHNLASEAFTGARRAGGPLAEWAAYYEAEQDQARGRVEVSIRECAAYRRRYRTGHHRDDCLRLMAIGQARLGRSEDARSSAADYDKTHRLGPITEQVELTLARTLVQRGHVEQALPILRELAIRHHAPLTGRVAEEELARLHAAGHASAVIADDRDSLMARAVSLRDAKRLQDAWELFTDLAAVASDDLCWPSSWTRKGNASAGGPGTGTTSRTGIRTNTKPPETPSTRGAATACCFAVPTTPRQPTTRSRCRRSTAPTAAGGRPTKTSAASCSSPAATPRARRQFDVAGETKWARRARFYAAFATLMTGDLDEAVKRLTHVAKHERGWATEARYWRARAYGMLDRAAEAADDRAWILENDPHSWYATLLRPQPADAHPRGGNWPGVSFGPSPATVTQTFGQGHGSPSPSRSSPRTVPPPPVSGSLPMQAWPFDRPAPAHPVPELVVSPGGRFPPQPPLTGALWDDEAGRITLARFAARYGRYWSELHAVNDLATVGLYDLSGPLMSAWYEQWRRDYRRRRRTARKVRRVPDEDWRAMFLAARDHHHASRHVYGLWEEQDDPEIAEEAWHLGYPLAHATTVWESAHAHGVDPYLVLGLMRQESNYRANAVSRVGARGAMQIMPTTGHLLADLVRDVDFTAGDLHDPTLSVDYGIRYLGLLLQRFEGVFPLAVASYNGGPFNVHAWLEGPAADLPMDAFVEHIPFRETRDYVKRVTTWYATYVALYGPPGAIVAIPARPLGDHAEVVDF